MNQLPTAMMVSFTRCGHWFQWDKAAAFDSLLSIFLRGGGPAA